jgi:hypothetical protein
MLIAEANPTPRKLNPDDIEARFYPFKLRLAVKVLGLGYLSLDFETMCQILPFDSKTTST